MKKAYQIPAMTLIQLELTDTVMNSVEEMLSGSLYYGEEVEEW